MPTDWEALYLAGDTRWEKGEASPGLVDFLECHPDLPRGRVLVPGCGYGHDVRAWASAGFTAAGLDLAPSAVRLSREHTPPDLEGVKFTLGNFLALDTGELFDWVFEHTLYCAIDPAQRPDYVAAVRRSLKPGGGLLAVHYLIPDLEGPPFGTTAEEVETRFGEVFELIKSWVPRSYANRTNLERMYWWRKRT